MDNPQAMRAPTYRPDIDGLRAIAVTSVVLYHADLPFIGGGFAGVDVFFVISGFLIGTTIFQGVRGGSFSFIEFYARRARRILPALIAVIAMAMAIGALILSAAELHAAAKSALSALFAYSNVHFKQSISYFTPTAALDPMLMTWSLGVEEQFYLALPIILIGLRRFGDRTVLALLGAITLGSLVLCIHYAATAPTSAFYLLPPRAWELGIGVLLGVWMATGGKPASGRAGEALGLAALLVLAASLCLLRGEDIWPGWPTLAPVLATAALIATPDARVNRMLLAARPMVGIGLISYSWYLWHWPLMAFLHTAAVGEPVRAAKIAAVLLSFIFAYFTWRYVETPFRKGRADGPSTLRRYTAAIGIIALLVGSAIAFKGYPSRVPASASRIDEMIRAVQAGECMSLDGEASVGERGCQNQPKDRQIVMVIGDSHAAALAPAVFEHAKRQGKGWAMFSQRSCRPLAGVTVDKASDPAFAESCARFMRKALDWTRNNPQATDVVVAGLWTGVLWNRNEHYARTDGRPAASEEALIIEGVRETVRLLVRSGKRVHVAQDTPYWEFDPARATLSHAIPARRWLARLVSQRAESASEFGAFKQNFPHVEEDIARAVRDAGGRYFRTRDGFCEAGNCRYRLGETLYFVDGSHLSPDGAVVAMARFDEPGR